MDAIVNLDELVNKLLVSILLKNPKAKIAIVGPSTLDRDHSTLSFSDALSGTEAELMVVEAPEGHLKESHNSLSTLKRQMAELQRVYRHLKQPVYVEENAYCLSRSIHPNSLDFLYDHGSLGWIALERPSFVVGYGAAVSHVIGMYEKVVRPSGIIAIADDWDRFKNHLAPKSWEELVLASLTGHGLGFELHQIRDIDLRDRFPEIKYVKGKYGMPSNGPQLPCRTMTLCTKPRQF